MKFFENFEKNSVFINKSVLFINRSFIHSYHFGFILMAFFAALLHMLQGQIYGGKGTVYM
jgi:hypothetical protein